VPSPGPSRARPAGDVDDDDDEPFDSDAGDPKLLRDLHAGLKPTPLDEAALDEEVSDEEGEIEDDLPYGADKEVNSGMVDMMLELGDCNEDDMEWLPAKERKKVDAGSQERERPITMGLMFPPSRRRRKGGPTMFAR